VSGRGGSRKVNRPNISNLDEKKKRQEKEVAA